MQNLGLRLERCLFMQEKKLLAKVTMFLFLMFMLTNCNPGWSIAGYEISPSDTTRNTVYIEIIAHDSTEHWYADKVRHGDNWCFLHRGWENVRVQ
mgnify:FL=1